MSRRLECIWMADTVPTAYGLVCCKLERRPSSQCPRSNFLGKRARERKRNIRLASAFRNLHASKFLRRYLHTYLIYGHVKRSHDGLEAVSDQICCHVRDDAFTNETIKRLVAVLISYHFTPGHFSLMSSEFFFFFPTHFVSQRPP